MEQKTLVRRIIYILALLWSVAVYLCIVKAVPNVDAVYSILMRWYAFTGLGLLFATLTPGLIKVFVPTWQYNPLLGKMKRSLGVSAFYFICLHVLIAFSHNLDGSLRSILYLSTQHQWALAFSGIAFLIIAAMALTSFDYMVKLLGSRWKKLHRLVYLAGILILFHANLIGSNFTNTTSPTSILVNIIAMTYIVVEVGATAKRLAVSDATRPSWLNQTYYTALALLIAIPGFLLFISFHRGVNDPHSVHRSHGKQSYLLQLSAQPTAAVPKKPLELVMQIIDPKTGKPLAGFDIHQEKYMHLIIVSHDLTYYDHIHPEFNGKDSFKTTIQLPHDGTYHLYSQYYIPAIGEHVSTAIIRTVDAVKDESPNRLLVTKPEQVVGQYHITLSSPDNLKTKKNTTLRYRLYDRDKPVTSLQPYLGAFGHLVIISEDLGTYLHVHPLDLANAAGDRIGPEVRFNTFFPQKGRYKLFAEFNIGGKMILSENALEVR